MKVYIFTEAGSKYGYGHIVRCSSLYSEINKRGIEVELIINGDQESSEAVADKKHRILNWLSVTSLTGLLEGNVYSIVDSYHASPEIYKYISNNTVRSVFIDDIIRLQYPRGIVVNPSIYSKELSYPSNSEIEYLLGPEYVILRDSFLEGSRLQVRKAISEILVTLGGSDIKELTPKILHLLKVDYPHIRKNVIIGKGYTNSRDIDYIEDPNIQLFYNVRGDQMRDLMLRSDLAITAAGQTIFELIKTETPFIPIQVIDNQEINSKALLAYKIVSQVLQSDDLNFMGKLSSEIKGLLKEESRLSFISNLQGLIDGAGSSRIVNKLIGE